MRMTRPDLTTVKARKLAAIKQMANGKLRRANEDVDAHPGSLGSYRGNLKSLMAQVRADINAAPDAATVEGYQPSWPIEP